MDERIRHARPGTAIPKWDLEHRLPIDRDVSPVCMDTATIFRITDQYMDVTDQPYLRRHMVALAVLICFSGVIFGLFFTVKGSTDLVGAAGSELCAIALVGLVFIGGFGAMALRFGRDEFFALTRRTVRFSRKHGKIYAVRRRRFFSKSGQGDIICEAPWAKATIFCLHKGIDSAGVHYHIRCYIMDGNDYIVQSFAIGREWPAEDIQFALAQWNFWRRYMSEGPAALPPPPIYIAESEDWIESFFMCMYGFGFMTSGAGRLVVMPFIVVLTIVRRLSLFTCRDPKWPREMIDQLASGLDAYNEPVAPTPVGWKATLEARHAGDYPAAPSMRVPGWVGLDEQRNAKLWERDELPDELTKSS